MVDSSTKVVQLGAQEAAADDSRLFARYPAPFNEAIARGKTSLHSLLQAMFDNVDDALFELADRAENNAVQNMYFESMREVRIKRRGMEIGFSQSIDKAINELIRTDVPQPQSLGDARISADKLALVAHDELEELVAVDSMTAKAGRCYQLPLQYLSKRLDSMIEARSIDSINNPFGPTTVCQSFNTLCGQLSLDIKAKLVLFKLFDRYVVSCLETVYDDTNKLLIKGGILPRLEQGAHRKPGLKSRGSTYLSEGSASQSGAGLEQDVFANLQALLHEIPQPQEMSVPVNGLTAPGQAPQIPRNTLLQLLQQMQQAQMKIMQQQQAQAISGIVPRHINVQQSLDKLLSCRMPTKSLSIGQVDDDAINLVAMLFQFILDDRNLSAPMKALIGRLQIPIIKVAMQDKEFFSKGGHPARKLLNEIANAGLGWVPNDNLDRDPLYKKVESVVNQLLNEFENDTALFNQILTDFVSFMEVQGRRADLVAKRTIDAEDGKAKSEVARAYVLKVLNDKVKGMQLPPVVIELLQSAWSNVLFLSYLKEGEGSKNWLEALAIVDDLLWSVQAPESSESRQKLLKMLPGLLKTLRNGLSKTGYDAFEMNRLFAELEGIHLGRLKEKRSVPAAGLVSPTGKTLDELLDEHSAVKPPALKASTEKNTINDETFEASDQASSPQASALNDEDISFEQVDALGIGSWVEVHQQSGNKFRCRLAAIIRATGRYIFVNRSGMKVAEHNRLSLAQSIKLQQISMLDDSLLFDRALESVIGNLRGIKEKTNS